jgi:hypothetical protein
MTNRLEQIKKDIFVHGHTLDSSWVGDLNWLVKTVEQQQSRIKELETIQQAYEALKKAL